MSLLTDLAAIEKLANLQGVSLWLNKMLMLSSLRRFKQTLLIGVSYFAVRGNFYREWVSEYEPSN